MNTSRVTSGPTIYYWSNVRKQLILFPFRTEINFNAIQDKTIYGIYYPLIVIIQTHLRTYIHIYDIL